MDTSYFLEFKFSVAMEQQGIGRIMITPYVTVVCDHKSLRLDLLLAYINEKLQKIFDKKIDSLLVPALWSALDLRNNCKPNFSVNTVSEYNTWPELFNKIDQLISCSASVISDINRIEDFLDVLKGMLDIGINFKDIVKFRKEPNLAFCYLIYCKLFKHDLLPDFSEQIKALYVNYKRKKEIYDFIDEIQNYELPI